MSALDLWRERSRSVPIHIPRKGENVVIGTFTHEYMIKVCSISKAIVRGSVLNTPPKYKHFEKGDEVIFHIDNILD